MTENGIGSPRPIAIIDGLGWDYLDNERGVPLFRWDVRAPKPHRGSPMNWHLLLPFDDDPAR
jgi:hypothetical protein